MAEGSGFSRRAFIGSVTAAGAAALAPAAGLAQRPAASRGGLIDFHHHFDPPPAVTGRQGGNQRWTAPGTVEDMEKAGVGIGMANLTASGTQAGEAGRTYARTLNDWGAKTVGDYKGKFGLFAALPMLDVDGALKEVEYAYDTLKVDGVGIGTSYEGAWLGDAKFKPLWSELNRRNGIVYVHPNDDQCCTTRTMSYESGNGLSSAWLEWPVNTARTIMSLMVNGVSRDTRACGSSSRTAAAWRRSSSTGSHSSRGGRGWAPTSCAAISRGVSKPSSARSISKARRRSHR